MIVNTLKAGVGIIVSIFGYHAICSGIAKAKVANHKKHGDENMDYESEFWKIRNNPGEAFVGWMSSSDEKKNEKESSEPSNN